MPHKPTFREGVCRMAAPFPRGHAAWEHLGETGMPHTVAVGAPQRSGRQRAMEALVGLVRETGGRV